MKVLIVAEIKDGAVKKTSLELLSQAQQLNASDVAALLIGHGVAAHADKLAQHGASQVLLADHEMLAHYTTDGYTHAVEQAAKSYQPDLILFSASINGKDLSPRVAARLDAALASDAVELSHNGTHFVAKRPIFAGKAYANVSVQAKPALVSLRANVIAVSAADAGKTAQTAAVELSLTADNLRTRVLSEEKSDDGKLDVAEADMIVSGGRGLKGPENFHLVEGLASALGAAVGASRAVVDAGWRPHGEQVGQTGKTVSPTLYVAAGISGAMQHMAGMSSSKYIVAINTDAEAPIFKVATYGMVADALEVLPQLTEAIKKIKG